MTMSDLRFGTSGLRGPASELEGPQTARHVAAFVAAMRGRGLASPGTRVLVARDLRASSPAIAFLCAGALAAEGLVPVDCGRAPTPALALAAMAAGAPAVMVTGSHIPEDRNGLKFYRPDGEIDKADEAAILAALTDGAAIAAGVSPVRTDIVSPYLRRYLDFFDGLALAGLHVGVYQHSSVARDLLVTLLRGLGARVTPLGRAEGFVAIDTEALRDADIAAARRWGREHHLDAIVSTDGDADRPLIADGEGEFLPGDLVGAITAQALGAAIVVAPVTANSALESRGMFARVARTRIGSPHVIAGMAQAAKAGGVVVGFEANGGVLLGSDIERNGRRLARLPTRDAVLPILCVLSACARSGTLASLAASFGFRPSAAGKIANIDEAAAHLFMERLASGPGEAERRLPGLGGVVATDLTDGVRLELANGGILHYRRSGNAPELRCYVEAEDAARAADLLARGLGIAGRELAVEALA